MSGPGKSEEMRMVCIHRGYWDLSPYPNAQVVADMFK